MKFLFFLALSIIFMVNGLPIQNSDIEKTTLCVYTDNSKQIFCQRSEIKIQCDAFVVGQKSIRFLGISQQPIDSSNPELVKYFVYPRKEKSSTYLDHSNLIEGRSVENFLYYGEKSDNNGLRVPNLSCWNKLLDVLKGTEQIQKVKLTDSNEEVSLIGEIFIDDFSKSKRTSITKGYGYYGSYYF
ncbi:unnamed protein product [Brachionus calyciflorus]|uniref:Uncharacterized protein n=1 Tax=Brachionus calyciflorus TaxID=104777 RepID=A0A814AKS5_9BILA|nr:unnamed protein product [Brachionus calyciflorus]